MSWAKFDDQYPDHPKIVSVGPLGMALHTAATCYCARYLTDGFIPAAMMGRLMNFDGITINNNAVTNKQITDELIRVGLLEVVPGGYMVHDYLEYNPPAAKIKEEKAQNAKRQADYRENHRGEDGKFGSNGKRNALPTTAPSPSPSQPLSSNGKVKSKAKSQREATPRDPLLDCEAVVIYRNIAKLTPNAIQRQAIYDTVKNTELWEAVCTDWLKHGWNKANVSGMLEAYSKGGIQPPSNGNGHNNGFIPRKVIKRDANGNEMEFLE